MVGRLVIALAAAAAVITASSAAFACGGFFCQGGLGPNGPQPVNQVAERIIFSKNADGTVTAIVQVMYEGPSDQFGWVLPVKGIPEVGVSSDAVFDAVQDVTNPTYTINTTFESCGGGNFGGGNSGGGCGGIGCASYDSGGGGNNALSAGGEEFESEPPPVIVVDSGAVGPYDYVIIQVDEMATDRVQLALDWLEENNYQATDLGPELLDPYLEEGFNLLATRLQKSQDAGAIRPLRLTYDDEHPMIPIKLTAVAANDDMGVLVWVLGDSQAVPLNYKSFDLNDALIDWFQPGQSYDQVVTVAANEASGQGFVTEFAQESRFLLNRIYTTTDDSTWSEILEADWTEDPRGLIDAVSDAYALSGWDGLEQAVDVSFPTATAEEKEEVIDCGSCAWAGTDLPADFVPGDFAQAVDDYVVGPIRETQELFDASAYVTRLYTNISAHEMTLDPSFSFNPDLEDVSNQHEAEIFAKCSGDWEATVPSGSVVHGFGQMWPLTPSDPDLELPATLRIRQMTESGPGEVVRDNTDTIRDGLAVHEMRQQALSSDESACASARAMPDGALVLLALGFFGIRLRRRYL